MARPGVAMNPDNSRETIDTCRRRAEATRAFAHKIVKGKAQQFLLTLADDYDRAAEALERGEQINGRILEYLKDGVDVRKG